MIKIPMNRFTGLRNFLLIWAGQLISAVGSRLSNFALGIWVLRTTGSTMQFAMTFVAMVVPALLISPFAGALVDRLDRRQLMIVCDSLSAAVMLVLAALLASGHLAIWHIYVGVGCSSLCNTFHSPAFTASIPLLAAREQLPRVNGMVQTGNAIAAIIGPLLAGVLVNAISLHGVLIADALTFLVAVSALTLSRIPRLVRKVSEERSSLLQDAAIGWRYVQQRSGLLGLLGVEGFNSFLFAMASVLIAPLLLSFSNPAMVGVQYAISGGGLLLGGLAMAAFGGPQRRIHGVLMFSIAAGFFLAIHGLWPSFTLVAAAGFILFLMLPVIAASNNSLWQSKVPADLQGRCFAIQQVLSNAATPIGYCLSGPLSEYVFEPLLTTGGALTGSVGLLIGVGPGRGIGLMFVVLGILMMFAAIMAYSVPAVRNIDELPDAFLMQEKTSLTSHPSQTPGSAGLAEGLTVLPQEAR